LHKPLGCNVQYPAEQTFSTAWQGQVNLAQKGVMWKGQVVMLAQRRRWQAFSRRGVEVASESSGLLVEPGERPGWAAPEEVPRFQTAGPYSPRRRFKPTGPPGPGSTDSARAGRSQGFTERGTVRPRPLPVWTSPLAVARALAR
jgi:hypothetical protein